jgi:hypothetical protein
MVTGRQVAVLARVDGTAAAARLSEGVRRQRFRPGEVVAVVDPPQELACRAVAAALGEVADLGVSIRAVPGAGEAGWLERAASAARSPWAAPWPDGADEHYLLDLACARECSRADAVGPGGAGYAYCGSLEPALARREFFGPGGLRPGARLFSIS